MRNEIEADVTTDEGRRLVILRKIRSGGTSIRFAQICGMTSSYISAVMKGSHPIGKRTAKKLEEQLFLIPGVLQRPEKASLLDSVSADSFFLNHKNIMLEEILEAEANQARINELRLNGLKAIMGRLSPDEFCKLHGFKRPLILQVLGESKPFPLTLAVRLEKMFKLKPGSFVYPDESYMGKRQFLAELHGIHEASLKAGITPSGAKLLDCLKENLKHGRLSDGQIMALTVMIEKFTAQSSDQA